MQNKTINQWQLSLPGRPGMLVQTTTAHKKHLYKENSFTTLILFQVQLNYSHLVLITGCNFLVSNTKISSLITTKNCDIPDNIQNKNVKIYSRGSGHETEAFHVNASFFCSDPCSMAPCLWVCWQTVKKEVIGYQGSRQLTKNTLPRWRPLRGSKEGEQLENQQGNRLIGRPCVLQQAVTDVTFTNNSPSQSLSGGRMKRRCVPSVFYVTPHQRGSLWN